MPWFAVLGERTALFKLFGLCIERIGNRHISYSIIHEVLLRKLKKVNYNHHFHYSGNI